MKSYGELKAEMEGIKKQMLRRKRESINVFYEVIRLFKFGY